VGSPGVRYLLAAQAVALLVAAGTWLHVWHCPCESALQNAAFWTALTTSQTVVVIGLLALRLR
jgi:hypothetical protein